MSRGNKVNHPLGPRKQFCLRGHDTFVCERIDGHCRNCEKERQKIVRETNKEKIKEWFRIYYLDNKERINKRNREYAKTHIEQMKTYRNRYPWLERIRGATRQHKRRLRIPKFGQHGIDYFYNQCPLEMVVDHIISLCGRLVSGLHVIWNLQYLTKPENDMKHIQFDGTLANNMWRKK